MTVKAGYKGRVYINDKPVGGIATWAYSGSTRAMLPIDQFGDEVITDIPGQITGGDVTITGNYLLAGDEGQQELAARFADGAQITNLKLYTDYIGNGGDVYRTPDTDTTPASYATVTNYDNVGDDKSGIGTFTATLHISGCLKQMGDTSIVQVETVGVHSIGAEVAELVGNFVSYGTEAGEIECYFKYGTTTEMSDGPSAPVDAFTAETGLFGADLAGLAAGTVYYQAVAKYDTAPVLYAYGAVKEFTAEGA